MNCPGITIMDDERFKEFERSSKPCERCGNPLTWQEGVLENREGGGVWWRCYECPTPGKDACPVID